MVSTVRRAKKPTELPALTNSQSVRRVRSGTRNTEGQPQAPTTGTTDYNERFSNPPRSFSQAHSWVHFAEESSHFLVFFKKTDSQPKKEKPHYKFNGEKISFKEQAPCWSVQRGVSQSNKQGPGEEAPPF